VIDEEFRTDNDNEFQCLGPATLRDEALQLVLAKQQCSLMFGKLWRTGVERQL